MEILGFNPHLIVATSFVLAPTLRRLKKKNNITTWLDAMDSAFETRKLRSAGLIRNIFFRVHERPALLDLIRSGTIITYISAFDMQKDLRRTGINLEKDRHFVFPNMTPGKISPFVLVHFSRIVFIGDFSYRHNRKMLGPTIQFANKLGLPLHVYGNKTNKQKNTYENVFFHGYVSDEKELYKDGDLHIALVQQRCGINNKVINPLIKGLPVITTTAGMQGVNKSKGLICLDKNIDFEFSLQELTNKLRTSSGKKIWNGFQIDESSSLIKKLLANLNTY